MQVEILMYTYMAVCLSMIVFNCVCVYYFKRNAEKLDKRNSHLAVQMLFALEEVQKNGSVPEAHKLYLIKKLQRSENLLTFDEMIDAFQKEYPKEIAAYLVQNRTVFIFLTTYYKDRNDIKTAYLAYLLYKYKMVKNMPLDIISGTMLALLRKKSLYCRENALRVLYSAGDIENMLEALKILDNNGEFHHEKLLCDGLLTFSGDHKALIAELWENFEQFSTKMQVTILNYIRFKSDGYAKQMLDILADEQRNDEVRFACIRYFGKYTYAPAAPLLVQMCSLETESRWEYAAISASELFMYPGADTTAVLKKCLHSSNWYVRLNAATSLERLGFTYSDLSDVFTGNDRYASEVLAYTLEHKEICETDAKKGALEPV